MRFSCPDCQKQLRVQDAAAGRLVACPNCKNKIRVPAAIEPEEFVITEAATEETAVARAENLPRVKPMPKAEQTPAPRPPMRERNDVDEDRARPRRRSRSEDDAQDWEDEPRPRRRRDDDDYDDERARKREQKDLHRQLRDAQFGLLFFYWRFILFICLILCQLVTSLVMAFSPQAVQAMLLVFVILGLITFFGIPILGITGGAFIARAPEESDVRRLGIVVLAFEIIPPICGILTAVLVGLAPSRPGAALLSVLFILAANVAMLASFIVFMTFLQRFAYYFSDRGTGTEAARLRLLLPLTILGGPVSWAVAIFLLRGIGVLGLVIVSLMVIAWFVLILRHLMGINRVIVMVRSRI